VIYLDSSALLKLLVQEAESEALSGWLSAGAGAPVSSVLARLEVIRAVRRLDASAVASAQSLMAQVDLVPLTPELINEAAFVGEPHLRSLDAIHLATALSLRADLTAFVAYDKRLISAAEAAGLLVDRPGAAAAT
jgi:hypothetical protein